MYCGGAVITGEATEVLYLSGRREVAQVSVGGSAKALTALAAAHARNSDVTLRWTAALFIVGSALFALGALPSYSEAVGLSATAATFFIGSLFFTSAAFGQYMQAVDDLPSLRRVWVWAPRDLGWLASVVQLAGTIWFNWSTGNALRHNISAAVADERVWRPDMFGSIAFLVASGLAYATLRRDGSGRVTDRTQWWIAALNLLGSVAFGVSAVAAYVTPTTGSVWHAELSNLERHRCTVLPRRRHPACCPDRRSVRG